MSRRRLLSRVAAAATGLVVAGTLTQRDIREAKAAQLKGEADIAYAGAVEGTNNNSSGYGVWGKSTEGTGVHGKSTNNLGVYGNSFNSNGVYGSSSNSNGVYGYSDYHNGVYGSTDVATKGGVLGTNFGVNGAGVLGTNSASGGIGVKGQGNVIGIKGESTNGYGGHFQGVKAQVKLLPNSKLGRLTNGAHQQGELFLDKTAALFICTASSTPGKWSSVETTEA